MSFMHDGIRCLAVAEVEHRASFRRPCVDEIEQMNSVDDHWQLNTLMVQNQGINVGRVLLDMHARVRAFAVDWSCARACRWMGTSLH